MPEMNILSNDFAEAVAAATRNARERALRAGHSVTFVDESGRYLRETPDGRRSEIGLHPQEPRESHDLVSL
jgi:hypothetical protein